MSARPLALAALAAFGCSEPPLASVRIDNGVAERVLQPGGAVLEGSFDLIAATPPAGEETQLLLVSLSGAYRYPAPCPPWSAALSVTADRSFPLSVDPGSEVNVGFSLSGRDPLRDDCDVPEALELTGSYYDSVADEYHDSTSIALDGSIELAIDPNILGESDFTCIGELTAPTFTPGTSKGTVWLRDFETGDVIPGTPVKVCAVTDSGCNAPVDAGTTDIVGVWSLAVPTSEPYYYETTAQEGFASGLFFEYVPPGDPGFERVLTPLAEAEIAALLATLGVAPDPGRGHVLARVLDCALEPGVGVSVQIGAPGEVVGYWQDGALTPAATATTADGFALVAGVPEGPATLVANLAVSGDPVATRLLHVRAGAVSFVSIDPRPSQP